MAAPVNALPRRRPILCLVTPGPRFAREPLDERSSALGALVREAVGAGLDLVQIREPDLDARVLTQIAREAVIAARGSETRIVINDRVDVALAAGADGVHLGGRSLPPGRVREMTPARFLLGRSVHGSEEAADLAAAGALDYLIAGTVFQTASKPGERALLGPDGLAGVVRAVRVPVLGIGGIDLDTIPAVARAGAAGFAAIQLFARAFEQQRLGETVNRAREAFDTALVIP